MANTTTSPTRSSAEKPRPLLSRPALRWAVAAFIILASVVAAYAVVRAFSPSSGRPGQTAAASWRSALGEATGSQANAGNGTSIGQRLSGRGLNLAAGTVQSVEQPGSFTLKTLRGATVTVTVSAATIYRERGASSASLADVTAGGHVVIVGTRAADGEPDRQPSSHRSGGPGQAPVRLGLRPARLQVSNADGRRTQPWSPPVRSSLRTYSLANTSPAIFAAASSCIAGNGVRVGVERDRDGGVPKALGDDLGVNAGLQGQGGVR